MSDLFDVSRQDGAGHRRLARDRTDDRARTRPGWCAGDRLLAQARGRRGRREGARAAWRLRRDPGRRLHAARRPELARAVEQRFAALDILVNNAGAAWGAPLEEFPPGGWDKVSHTNVEGVFHLTVALLGALRAAGDPADPARVINIGSIDGLRAPSLENYSYSASKAAVHMLTRHLAKRLAGEHITVNAIAPGPFQSKMTAFFLDEPESREAVAQTVPLGRIGRPDDVAGLTLMLASRAGSYLTGTVIPLDGGITGCDSPPDQAALAAAVCSGDASPPAPGSHSCSRSCSGPGWRP